MNKGNFFQLMDYVFNKYQEVLSYNVVNDNCNFSFTIGTLQIETNHIKIGDNRLFVRKISVYEGGELALHFIIGLSAMLYSKQFEDYRIELLNTNAVKGVAAFKNRVFNATTVPAAVIILDKNSTKTWFCEINDFEELWALISEDDTVNLGVIYSDTITNYNLSPKYYQQNDIVEEVLSKGSIKHLEEVAEIINCKSAKPYQLGNNGIPYLRARCLQNGNIVRDNAFVLNSELPDFSKQILQSGDILLSKFFGQYKLAQVKDSDLPAIASNALFIIRPFDIGEKYLYRYLSSKTGNTVFRKQLEKVEHGITVSSITKKDLMKIEIPMFDDDLMDSLEDSDNLEGSKAEETINKLIKATTGSEHITSNVLKDLLSVGWDKFNYKLEEYDDKLKLRSDISFALEKTTVIFEIKNDLFRVSYKWVSKILELLESDNNVVFVLTTGTYYEVHLPKVRSSYKLLHTPTPDDILNLIKEGK